MLLSSWMKMVETCLSITSLCPPKTCSNRCAAGWVSLTLTEIMRDLPLAEELKHILQ